MSAKAKKAVGQKIRVGIYGGAADRVCPDSLMTSILRSSSAARYSGDRLVDTALDIRYILSSIIKYRAKDVYFAVSRRRRRKIVEVGYPISPEYLLGTNMQVTIKEQHRIVGACKELGMVAVFSAEHLSRGDSIWLPPMLTLSNVCEAGEGMLFGTAVLAAGLHNPVSLAEQVGFMNAATGGRFVLGFASGWNRSEFESLGVPMETRGRALDETIDILRLLWGSAEPVSYFGDVYSFKDLTLSFRPSAGAAQQLWLEASSDRALRRAAEVADNWFVSSHMSTEQAASQVETYRVMLQENGRDFPLVFPGLKSVFVAPTMEAAKSIGGDNLTASYEMFKEWGLFDNIFNQKLDHVDYQKVMERAIIGDPVTVAEEIVDFIRATGVNLLLVRSL